MCDPVCGSDPGRWNRMMVPALRVKDYRIGHSSQCLEGSPFIRDHLRSFIQLGDVIHEASVRVLDAAMIACGKGIGRAMLELGICDVRNFSNAMLPLLASFRRKSRLLLRQQAPAIAWEALPAAWHVLPQQDGADEISRVFSSPIGAMQSVLLTAASKPLHDIVTVSDFFDRVRELVDYISELLIRLADRFSSAAVLKIYLSQLVKELPESLKQLVTFDAKSGLHHTEVIFHLLQTLENESTSPAKHMAEIGTHQGQTPAFLLERLPSLHVLTVDPYEFLEGGSSEYVKLVMQNRRIAFETLQHFGQRAAVLVTTSLEACSLMPNNFFDVVFVDGGQRDVEVRCWKHKVREGGFLVGHDFKCGMGMPYLREIFLSVPANETLHLAPGWVWYFRWHK